jgi:hypothetical protein
MSAVNIPDDLMSRAQILADTEGIGLEAFINRCVDDAVTHMEAAEAELDAADEVMPPAQPAKSSWLDRACAARSEPQAFHIKVYKEETPKDPEPTRMWAYQPKSQVRRELKQFEQPIPHPSESAQAVLEGLEKYATKKRRLDEEKEAARQANQRLLDECRRQAVEGVKRMFGIDKG